MYTRKVCTWGFLEAVQKVVAFSVTLPSKKKEGIG
jgi:hypothetical protein